MTPPTPLSARFRGGLASATVIGCGGFAALSGSSVASALTMGKVALGEMDRYDYDTRLSTGVVAAGGTLGILIPPSTGFVIYAILTEQSIGRLFLAGVFPGFCCCLPCSLPPSPCCAGCDRSSALAGPRTSIRRKAARIARCSAHRSRHRLHDRWHIRVVSSHRSRPQQSGLAWSSCWALCPVR